jgi:hypothetical protein
MEENNRENETSSEIQTPGHIESPAEKLEIKPPTGSLIPGPENPESEEIKEEKSPNTE